MLTNEEIFDALDYSTLSRGPQSFVLAFARAIEAKVLEGLGAQLPGRTHEHALRALADDIRDDRAEKFDAQACLQGADEISQLRAVFAGSTKAPSPCPPFTRLPQHAYCAGQAPVTACTFPNCKAGQCCVNPSNAGRELAR